MIPDIGLMIAFYIVTRMLQFFGRSDEKMYVKVFCIITVLVTIICAIDLLSKPSQRY